MSIFLWQAERVAQLEKLRKKQSKCERCGQFYLKTLHQCPHCSNLNDYKVKLLLKKRAIERISLGRYMFLFAMLILVILYFF